MADNQQYALVTGASSGIGLRFSVELAKRGYNIIAVSNQNEQLEQVKKTIESGYRVEVRTICMDLSEMSAASTLFDYCSGQNLFVEVLINNAGMFIFGEAANADYTAIRSMLSLHVVTPALLCRKFGETMLKNGKGYILNVSSIASKMAYPGISLYGPTKSFVRNFTRALRTEMKAHGVYVTCLIPGAVATPFYNSDKYNTRFFRFTGLMKNPESVAQAGIISLFSNRPVCIPGFINKLIFFILPLIPHSLIYFLSRNTKLLRK